MATEAQLEALSSELSAYHRAKANLRPTLGWVDVPAFNSAIRAEQRLTDAAIACGMPVDYADLEGWSAQAVCDFLRAA